ncbi:hypothetical protein [Rhodococcus qingshengii]|uniref:hypothetical protein n=1 Tax=Rhodococcus qingshengii TaxID=334542 RepID=UPI0035E021D9
MAHIDLGNNLHVGFRIKHKNSKRAMRVEIPSTGKTISHWRTHSEEGITYSDTEDGYRKTEYVELNSRKMSLDIDHIDIKADLENLYDFVILSVPKPSPLIEMDVLTPVIKIQPRPGGKNGYMVHLQVTKSSGGWRVESEGLSHYPPSS